MIGNERVELMLFDTTGQVIIVALGSFSSNHSSSAATSVNAYAAAHDLAHFHRESFRPSFEARLIITVPSAQFVEPAAPITSSIIY